MSLPRLPLLALVVALLAAGCASPEGGEADAAVLDDEEGVLDVPGGTDAPADGGSGERWRAFAFDERVTPRSGGAGMVASYTVRMSEEDDGEVRTFDMKVDLLGESTRDIRTKRMSFAGGDHREEVVTASVRGRDLQHTITVVRDDSGDEAAGSVTIVRGFEPLEEQAQTWLFGYARMETTYSDGSVSLVEYFAPAEAEDGVVHLPYQEGEDAFSSSWGSTLFTMAYNPIWLAGWADGSQEFEEGTWAFGGYSYETVRKTLSVGEYTFDGWRVEWNATAGDSTATWMFEVAPALPIPVAYRFGGSDSGSGGSSSHWTYELRDLRLA